MQPDSNSFIPANGDIYISNDGNTFHRLGKISAIESNSDGNFTITTSDTMPPNRIYGAPATGKPRILYQGADGQLYAFNRGGNITSQPLEDWVDLLELAMLRIGQDASALKSGQLDDTDDAIADVTLDIIADALEDAFFPAQCEDCDCVTAISDEALTATFGTIETSEELLDLLFGDLDLDERDGFGPTYREEPEDADHTTHVHWAAQKKEADPTSPTYYQFPNCQVTDISSHLTSNGGQALQYIARSTRLDGNNKGDIIENLRKAQVFLDYEIARLATVK